jgi:hypothetical protein
MAIRDEVKEHSEELTGIADTEGFRGLRKWGLDHGYNSQVGFGNYKKALLSELNIDYSGRREEEVQHEDAKLRSAITHRVELFADYRHATDRFAVLDEDRRPLWHDHEYTAQADQLAGEKDVVRRAVWLAHQAGDEVKAEAVELRLHVTDPQMAQEEVAWARQKHVALTVIQEVDNPAETYTLPSNGFLKHPKGEELVRLARPASPQEVEREEIEDDKLAARVAKVHRDRTAWEEQERETLREEEARALATQGRER